MDAQTTQTQVLVVGAGPVGALLALELAHHGVACTVVERSVSPPVYPKMDYINGRSMELLRRLGLAKVIRDHGIDPDYSTDFLWTRDFAEPPVAVWHHPSVNKVRQRFQAVNDGSAPVEPYQRIQGSVLEGLLRAAARRHPLVDLREGTAFVHLAATDDDVMVSVAERDGRQWRIRAGYVAACDGGRSVVRRRLGILVDDAGPRTRFLSVYFRSRDPVLRQHGRAFVTVGARGLTLVSRDEKDGWTGSVPVTGTPPTSDPVDLVRQRLGADFAVDDVLAVTSWEGSLGVAETYRLGRVFLAGDAAHQYFPAGGHGANTGLADAVDLGWKLAARVNGWGGDGLLDSYERERRPVALFNREMCDILLGVARRFGRLAAAGAPGEQLAGVLEQEVHHIDNLGVQFGHRYADSPVICHEAGGPDWHWRGIIPTTWPGARVPAVRLRVGEQVYDRFGTGLTLVDLTGSGAGAPMVEEAARRGIPVTHLPLDDDAVRSCWERDLVLVRPDHHVAWRGNVVPPDWAAVLDRVTGRGIA